VRPLLLSHLEKFADPIWAPRFLGGMRGLGILRDISPFEERRTPHREEPARDAAESSEERAGPALTDFQVRLRLGSQFRQHFPQSRAVRPFFALDRSKVRPFLRGANGLSMSSIRERSGKLTRMYVLQQPDESGHPHLYGVFQCELLEQASMNDRKSRSCSR